MSPLNTLLQSLATSFADDVMRAIRGASLEMPRVLADGRAKKKLTKKGQKRATTYFAA